MRVAKAFLFVGPDDDMLLKMNWMLDGICLSTCDWQGKGWIDGGFQFGFLN